MKHLIIGYGEIGKVIGQDLQDTTTKNETILAKDINEKNEKIIIPLRQESDFRFIGEFDCVHICLPTHEEGHIDELIKEMNNVETKRIIIHSTIQHPFYIDMIKEKVNCEDIVYLPNRYNGGTKENNDQFEGFVCCGIIKTKNTKKLSRFLEKINIRGKPTTDVKELVIAKLYENIQRNTLIQLANKMELLCIDHKINFEKVTKFCSNKSNFIPVESGYISGHCLPYNHLFLGINKINLNNKYIYDTFNLLKKYLIPNNNTCIFGLSYKDFAQKRISDLVLNDICYHPYVKNSVVNFENKTVKQKLMDYKEFISKNPKYSFKENLIIILRWNKEVKKLIKHISEQKNKITIIDLFGSVKKNIKTNHTKQIKLISLNDLNTKEDNEL